MAVSPQWHIIHTGPWLSWMAKNRATILLLVTSWNAEWHWWKTRQYLIWNEQQNIPPFLCIRKESLIPFSTTVTFLDTPFRQFDPIIFYHSFTTCFAILKISFWWLGLFKSLVHSFCFFPFAQEITLFTFCLLFLYSFHASDDFSFFPISILFFFSYCFSNFLIPPQCFLMTALTLWQCTCDLCCLYHYIFHPLPVFIHIKVFPLCFRYLIFDHSLSFHTRTLGSNFWCHLFVVLNCMSITNDLCLGNIVYLEWPWHYKPLLCPPAAQLSTALLTAPAAYVTNCDSWFMTKFRPSANS